MQFCQTCEMDDQVFCEDCNTGYSIDPQGACIINDDGLDTAEIIGILTYYSDCCLHTLVLGMLGHSESCELVQKKTTPISTLRIRLDCRVSKQDHFSTVKFSS